MENRVEAEGDFYSNRHSLNSVSGVRVMSKIQSHSTDSHSDDCMSLSVSVVSQRHGQSQRQRDTHSHRHSHSHRDTVTAGCLLLYRNLPVSIPNSNYVYACRYFFTFWPPCCIRFPVLEISKKYHLSAGQVTLRIYLSARVSTCPHNFHGMRLMDMAWPWVRNKNADNLL